MLTVNADTLTFQLPTEWHEVTLFQATALLDAANSLDITAILSGVSVADLRAQRTPDLLTRLAPYLEFVENPPAFTELPPAKSITLNSQLITPPTNLGVESTVGQTFDVSAELKTIYDGLDEEESPSLYDVCLTVLGIYLAPVYHKLPYTDIEQAKVIHPYILSLPVTDALPLTAFFLTSTQAKPPSGRLSLRPAKPPVTMRVWQSWRLSLRRALNGLGSIST